MPGSPADDAGFVPGCFVTAVDGRPVRDILDWRWLSSEDDIELSYIDTSGDAGTVVLERDRGEDWGFEFEGAVYDGTKLCRNACTFCFMRQLPAGARETLVLRDDDFRLSFLQGNFVTLTNLGPEDEERIVEQHISPLRVSLHAVTPAVRAALMGRHAQEGIEACKRLLAAGIEMHMQVVLLPDVNDGAELERTLSWAYGHPGVLDVGIVPLGYTRFQDRFDRSFNGRQDSRTLLETIRPFQERALAERGTPWVFAADEFYRNAYPEDLLAHLPEAAHYGDYALFEDGVGMIRSTVDEWRASEGAVGRLAALLAEKGEKVHYVVGCAQREFLVPLVEASPLAGLLVPLPVENRYFGGNVDVTGLLCADDIVRAVEEAAGGGPGLFVIPEVVFNAAGVTLDDCSLEDMQNRVEPRLAVVSCNPSDYLAEIAALVQ